jgi:hypothetical protein
VTLSVLFWFFFFLYLYWRAVFGFFVLFLFGGSARDMCRDRKALLTENVAPIR